MKLQLLFLIVLLTGVAARPSFGQTATPQDTTPITSLGVKPKIHPSFAETIVFGDRIPPPGGLEQRDISKVKGPLRVEKITYRRIDDPRPCLRRGCFKSSLWLDTTFLRGILPGDWEQWIKDEGATIRMSLILEFDHRQALYRALKYNKVGVRATFSW